MRNLRIFGDCKTDQEKADYLEIHDVLKTQEFKDQNTLPRLTASELRALPFKEQERILEREAKRIAKYVDVIEDGFDIVEV